MPDAAIELELSGTSRERGRAYGEVARGAIAGSIDRWCQELARDHRHPEVTLRQAVARIRAAAHLDRWVPGLTDEIDGIAQGSGHDPALVTALSLMDEVWWLLDADTGGGGPGPGCSTLGAVPPQGSPLLGQTMDLPSCHAAAPVLLHVEPPEGPTQHVLSFAGSVGLCGWNDAGLAVCCNSVSSLPGRAAGLPVAGTVRAVLACDDVEAAWEIVRAAAHGCPQHVAVGGPDGLRGFQVSADGVVEHAVDPGRAYAHTNHPIIDDSVEPDDAATRDGRAHSVARLEHLRRHAATDLATAVSVLDDRSTPISCSGDARAGGSISAVTYVAELSAPPLVHYRVGPPGAAWSNTEVVTRDRAGSP